MTENKFDFSKGYRDLHEGMGQAVAERTILRKKADGSWENWGDVAYRVALGNSLLCKNAARQVSEFRLLRDHIAKATILMSGRHLQHGDETQPAKTMEVFTNCATAATSFLSFYLLLNGSGVGRSYDDDMMLVNWDYAPDLRVVIDENHQDYDYSAHESVRDAQHKYGSGKDVMWFEVPDSREGWAKALEVWEHAAFEKIHKDKLLILDFSKVRPKGAPIKGMQSRPSSGPVPLMNAFNKAISVKGAGLQRWFQAMYIDHYFSECVRVGGARRAARIAVKYWKDDSIFDFITIKRPIEFRDLNLQEIMNFNRSIHKAQGFLWSSNNSVGVDEEFWTGVAMSHDHPDFNKEMPKHARKVFNLLTQAAYADGTGEPAIINLDKLVQNSEGLENLERGDFVTSEKYELNEDTQLYVAKLARRVKKKKYATIVNPCGEIALNLLGGFCVIGDVVPFHADSLDEAEEAFRATTRALMRVNTMRSIYEKEVRRTNRIGVGITGIHEFAWKFFKLGFKDLIDEEKSKDFWLTMARFNRAVREEALSYAKEIGVSVPHTMTTVKPAGTTSKLFGLTEGWHLPSMAWYLRWVQFRNDDPLVNEYIKNGFPHRKLIQYNQTTIIGFPTAPVITQLGMADKLVTAGEATPSEQYQWLKLGEKYWINGTDAAGVPVKESYGNQISYTLKYKPELVDYKHFRKMLKDHQSQIRCCSVMPQVDTSVYEYQPEERVSRERFEEIQANIRQQMQEDIGKEHVECEGGSCPIDFKSKK
jgi:adenosylcobalamin-dependent ribonucleoside-triphosphate reductase